MIYETSLSFNGSVARAFAVAESILLPNAFIITEKTTTAIAFRGGGMTSIRQNPLLGASQIRIEALPGALQLTAELGGVRFMTYLVWVFPFGLVAFLTVLFNILPTHHPGLIPLIGALPWLVISPVIAMSIRQRTVRALNGLLHNMAFSSEA